MRLYKFYLSFFLLSLVGFLQAQTPRFYIQSDRNVVALGETFVLEAILENMESKSINISDVTPFKIVQGPSMSTSITIINGKRTGTISYQYVILATQKGKFTIPSATANIGTKVIKSNELTIQVSDPHPTTASKSDTKNETFVKLEVDDNHVFIGQQIVLNYVLYTRQNIESYNIINEPDLEGFYAQPINDIRDQPQRKTINGKEYYTQVVRRQILFPQKTGDYTIGPVNISLDIPVENGRSSFFFRETRKENIATNSLKIKVNDLPSNHPVSFSGGVGSFEMKAEIQQTKVNIGESIVLKMQIEGDGDPKIVRAPIFDIPRNIEKYEPTTIKDETVVVGNKIMVQKVFEYIFVPSKDTILTINPAFSYLSTQTGKYETIKSGPFNIQVIKGDEVVSKTSNSDNIALISTDKRLNNLLKSPWFSIWHIAGLGIILALTLFGIFAKKKRQLHTQQTMINNNKAGSIAKQNLLRASNYKKENNVKAFYEELALATTGYILKKFIIPNTEASLVDIKNHLSYHQVPVALISKYENIQKKCELARFAGKFEDMNMIYAEAESMINDMEE